MYMESKSVHVELNSSRVNKFFLQIYALRQMVPSAVSTVRHTVLTEKYLAN